MHIFWDRSGINHIFNKFLLVENHVSASQSVTKDAIVTRLFIISGLFQCTDKEMSSFFSKAKIAYEFILLLLIQIKHFGVLNFSSLYFFFFLFP